MSRFWTYKEIQEHLDHWLYASGSTPLKFRLLLSVKARLSSQLTTVGTAFWWVCTVQQRVASLWGGPCHAGPALTSPYLFHCLSSSDQVCLSFSCSPTAWAATPHKQTEQDMYTIPSSHNPVKEKWRKLQSENKMINYMGGKKQHHLSELLTVPQHC